MSKNPLIRFGLFVAIILAGLGWVIASPQLSADVDIAASASAPVKGYHAPDFQLQDINGFHYTLSDFKGRLVVINFWASWCPPCKAEMPAFQEVSNEYSIEEVIFIGVNVTNQDNINNVLEFLEDKDVTFPILLDQTGSVTNAYDVYSMPTTFFVDKDGIIQKVMIGGPIAKAAIRSEIEKLMDK
jgi:peroxiredoxin